MEKTKLRKRGDEWCELEVELKNDRLSIRGMAGEIMQRDKAEESALEYWRSFFEDSPAELSSMQQRFPNTCLHTPNQGAQFVVDNDGELHGIDVHKEDGDDILVTNSCGQITEELEKWFPEVKPFLKWHLNDMHAGCEHQDALGWKHGMDIAIDAKSATPKQMEVLQAELDAKVIEKRTDEAAKIFDQLRTSPYHRQQWLTNHKNELGLNVVTGWAVETIEGKPESGHLSFSRDQQKFVDKIRAAIAKDVEELNPLLPFRSAVFKDCLSAPCPECGYRYGTAWTKRALPPEVKAFVESVEDLSDEPPVWEEEES